MLILTGDPRRATNHFDPEVATIRRQLAPGLVTPQHLAMIELGEIAAAVDRLRPVILHISAHNGPGGIALANNGREHLVDPVELAEAIGRADHRPTCVVLGFCGSQPIAPQIARVTPAVGPALHVARAVAVGDVASAGDPACCLCDQGVPRLVLVTMLVTTAD